MGGPNSNNPVKLGELKFKVKYKDLCVASPGLSKDRPYGITVAGTETFRKAIEKALWNLMKNSKQGRDLIIELLKLLKEQKKHLLIFEHIESLFEGGSSGFQHYIPFLLNKVSYDSKNGRGDVAIECSLESRLAHELEHVRLYRIIPFDYKLTRECTDSKDNNVMIKYSEVFAILTENIVRVQMNQVVRTHYGGVRVFRKKFGKETKTTNYGDIVYILVDDISLPNENNFIKQHVNANKLKWTDSDLSSWKENYHILEETLSGNIKHKGNNIKRGSNEFIIYLK